MLNSYGGYLPNNTIDTVSGGQAQFDFGNSGGPAFHNGNYPQSVLGCIHHVLSLHDCSMAEFTKANPGPSKRLACDMGRVPTVLHNWMHQIKIISMPMQPGCMHRLRTV